MIDPKVVLEWGNKYPYDQSNDGEFTISNDWAVRAARGVVYDLCDRRDIKWAFGKVDEDIRKEIIETMASIIRKAKELEQ